MQETKCGVKNLNSLVSKTLTAQVGRLSVSVGWKKGLELGLKTVSHNP